MNAQENDTGIKIISPTVHSLFDYAFFVLFVVAPSVFELTGVFAYGAYGLALAYFLLSITTRYVGGLFDVLSLRVHAVLELLIALGMIASPWLFQFAGQPVVRNLFVLFGVVIFIVWILTRYKPQSPSPDPEVDQSSRKESISDSTDETAKEGNKPNR
jgi:hypothetical protein